MNEDTAKLEYNGIVMTFKGHCIIGASVCIAMLIIMGMGIYYIMNFSIENIFYFFASIVAMFFLIFLVSAPGFILAKIYFESKRIYYFYEDKIVEKIEKISFPSISRIKEGVYEYDWSDVLAWHERITFESGQESRILEILVGEDRVIQIIESFFGEKKFFTKVIN